MVRTGFIQDDLDLKLLILYIINHAAAPITFLQLLDLALCDAGVDYFSVCDAVEKLVARENLVFEEDRYSITEKGRRNSEICESSLPFSVRHHCDENLVKVNEMLRREQHVQGKVLPNDDGTVTVHLMLSDPKGVMLELQLLAPDVPLGDKLVTRFKSRPEATYHQVMALLMAEDDTES